ncbi:MAG: asparagine--tRNA ligase, partial [Flavobacteriaceae bacterium]
MDIRQLFLGAQLNQKVHLRGWVRTFRANRFIALNDGSCLANMQCVVNFEQTSEEVLAEINTGAAIEVVGTLVESQGKGQKFEIQVDSLRILGASNPDEYPIQPKKHSLEFLREKAHLRVRTNTFAAVMRVRAALSFAVHQYFTDNGFYQVHTPIITGSDAEGAGEMFRVTTLDPNNPSDEPDFFGKETNLTVSGQLEAETYAMGLGKVYTFGPTFRAENSNTSRHLAEFWMIEPEVAFNNLDDNMDLAEDFIKSVLAYVLEHCQEDLTFLDQRFGQEEAKKPQQERSPMGLLERLSFVTENEFMRVSYTDAIEILRNSKPNKKKKFAYPIDGWGADLQSEHERYLVEKHFSSPVILFDYPAEIKAFYMRMNDDGKT